MKETRSRYWSTLAYQESVKEGWLSTLGEMGLQALISPLHDSDKWESDDLGEPPKHKKGDKKKAHWHIILCFDSVKSRDQIKEITDKLGFVGQIKVLSIKGSVRYLTHKDNPEKAQYNEKDIINIGAVDLEKLIKSKTDLENDSFNLFQRVFNDILEFQLFEFSDLVNFEIGNGDSELFQHIVKHAFFFGQYCRSMQFKHPKNVKNDLQ